jgi:cell division septum initiation protein DivIVA
VSMPDQYQRPPLRYRRFGGGYRREDVEFALAELRLTLRQLDKDLEALRERNRTLEAELQAARSEVERLRAVEHEPSHTMSGALRRAAEIEEVANAHARDIIAHAEEAATRIRSEASQRIEDSSEQFNELLRLKSSLLDAMRSVVTDFDQAISRVERDEQLFPHAAAAVALEDEQPWTAPEAERAWAPPAPEAAQPWPAPGQPPPPAAAQEAPIVPPLVPPVEQPAPAPPPVVPAPEPVAGVPPDTASIPAAPPPPPAPPPAAPQPVPPTVAASAPAEPEREELVFEVRVELDAGPFSDFAALSAFERTLAHLPKVEDVYVRRLADDRALIELTLSEPSRLLDAMHQSLPYSLEVRTADQSRIVVDVSVQAPAAAR